MWCGTVAVGFIIILLSLTSICVALAVDPASICPPEEIIEPCLCYKDCKECFTSIFCEDLRDQEVLSRILEESSEYQYASFTLKHSSVVYIPDTLFAVRNLHHLKVMESSFVSLFNRAPSKEPAINYIFLEMVQLRRGIQWEQFSSFTNLKRLVIFHTHLPKIDQAFINFAPKSLEELKINNCSMSQIHDEAFASLHNLLWVYVLSGKIKEVKRSMFPKPSKLQRFGFSGNRLSSLPEDIFSEMPDLKYIYLEGNSIKELPENTLGPVFPNLIAFYFEGNPLKCRCNIRWITGVDKHIDRRFLLGSCQDPKNLHGKEIRDLVPEDFLHCG